jgi:hypothetical protein
MDDKNAPGDKHPGTTDDSTETPLAETLADAQDEIEHLERHSAADSIELDYADERGGFTINLNYYAELRGGE